MSKGKNDSRSQLKQFQSKVRPGDYTKLSEKTGYSVSHVWRVMNGERGLNESILKSASAMVRNRK